MRNGSVFAFLCVFVHLYFCVFCVFFVFLDACYDINRDTYVGRIFSGVSTVEKLHSSPKTGFLKKKMCRLNPPLRLRSRCGDKRLGIRVRIWFLHTALLNRVNPMNNAMAKVCD